MIIEAMETGILHEIRYIENRVEELASFMREYCHTLKVLQQNEAPLSWPSLNSTHKRQILDENGYLTAVNEPWLRIMGYKQEEVIGKWFGDLLYPPDLTVFTKELLCNGKIGEVDVLVLRMKRNDGALVGVTFKAIIGFDDYGIFRRIFCEVEDITKFIRFDASFQCAALKSDQKNHIIKKQDSI
ncbi:MAG: PAS domain-containing protein [Geobacteraceae bacterium]|nr:PAS domain-containing protein [Geobacteraceae bacterium]